MNSMGMPEIDIAMNTLFTILLYDPSAVLKVYLPHGSWACCALSVWSAQPFEDSTCHIYSEHELQTLHVPFIL